MISPIPPEIADALKPHLIAIKRLFKASRITLVVRTPEDSNAAGNLVLSDDNPTLVIQAIRAQMVAEAQRFADEGASSGVDPKAEFPYRRNLDEIL